MEMYLNKEADQLIGALIGLARTCNMHLKTENTDRVILESMAAVFRLQKDKKHNTELSGCLQKVRKEQLTVAPDCATCPVRCGNTDEYDINLIRNDKKEICNLKMQLLYNACKMAADIITCQAETINITADISAEKQEEITQEISQIYKILCVISYDVDEQFLQRFL